MTVYTDGVHLMAETKTELHDFARRLGLKRPWYQDHPVHPHYDLTSGLMVARSLRLGAISVPTRDMLERCRNEVPPAR